MQHLTWKSCIDVHTGCAAYDQESCPDVHSVEVPVKLQINDTGYAAFDQKPFSKVYSVAGIVEDVPVNDLLPHHLLKLWTG